MISAASAALSSRVFSTIIFCSMGIFTRPVSVCTSWYSMTTVGFSGSVMRPWKEADALPGKRQAWSSPSGLSGKLTSPWALRASRLAFSWSVVYQAEGSASVRGMSLALVTTVFTSSLLRTSRFNRRWAKDA